LNDDTSMTNKKQNEQDNIYDNEVNIELTGNEQATQHKNMNNITTIFAATIRVNLC